jgi:hypothetical protein
MRRGRLNLVLLVAAIGLAAGVYFSQKKDDAGPPLTPLAADQVTRARIEHPGAPAIELRKQGDAWRLVEPAQIDADPFEVNAVIGLATTLTQDKVEGADLAQLGLAPPQYTITLNETRIDFGSIEPLQYRRYVKVGETVSTIEDPPSAALDKDWADLVAKELFAKDAAIEGVELPKLKLAKDPSGKWQVQPADPKATADSMQKLADGWQHARAMWNEMAKAPEPKGDRAKVLLKGGESREFVVVATDPQLKLQRPGMGVVYVLSKSLADELLKLPAPPPPASEQPKPADAPPAPSPAPGPAK